LKLGKERLKQIFLIIIGTILICVGYINSNFDDSSMNKYEIAKRHGNEMDLGDVELVNTKPLEDVFSGQIVPNDEIINNTVFGAASLAAAVYIMSTENYPLGSVFLEYLGTICGFANAASYFYEIKTTLDKKTASKIRNTQTPEQRAKTFTKNLQREIIF